MKENGDFYFGLLLISGAINHYFGFSASMVALGAGLVLNHFIEGFRK